MTRPTKWLCARWRLRSAWASTKSDQSSLCAQWVAKDPRFLHADTEDSDQTGWMPSLIRVFAERTCHFVGFVVRQIILYVSLIKNRHIKSVVQHKIIFFSYFTTGPTKPILGGDGDRLWCPSSMNVYWWSATRLLCDIGFVDCFSTSSASSSFNSK